MEVSQVTIFERLVFIVDLYTGHTGMQHFMTVLQSRTLFEDKRKQFSLLFVSASLRFFKSLIQFLQNILETCTVPYYLLDRYQYFYLKLSIGTQLNFFSVKVM